MSKRRYRQATSPSTVSVMTSELPIHSPVAVYYRQSTEGQIGNISTSIQTIDMVAYLKERGWKQDDIYMIDMDAGVSGTRKIDERPGMRRLFELISDGNIRTVACQDEDRLFRDITQIQVNIFIEACRKSAVLVITPSMVYDFANELTGTFHARQFRFKCEIAAEYINTVILGKLARAKKRMQNEGRWVGSIMPVGFMVDRRKKLPDGSENPQWRKLTPFEPYALVVREYFRLFLELSGNLHATARHIHRHGPFFPDPSGCIPPDGFFAKYRLNIHGGGFAPSLTGLADLLTNAAYMGHWSIDRTIRIYDNHPPLVTDDTFMRAFNYLSPVTLDGGQNSLYTGQREHARPSLDETRCVDRPLFAGILVSCEENEWQRVGTEYVRRDSAYRYVFRSRDPLRSILWTRTAKPIDQAIVDLLHQKLRATFNSELWQETLSAAANTYTQERRRYESQLASLNQVMERQIVSLDTLTNPQMIRAVQKRFEDAQEERARLQHAIESLDDESSRLAIYASLKDNFGAVLVEWESYTRDRKREIINTFVERIEIALDDDKQLLMTIRWRDESSDLLVIRPGSAKGRSWLPSETTRLLELLDSGGTQIDIAKEFPDRTWDTIQKHLYALRGKSMYQFRILPIHYDECYDDYVQRTNVITEPYKSRGEIWLHSEDQLLIELVDRKANRLAIAEQFPHRTWRSLQERIRKLCGTGVKTLGKGTMRLEETFATYSIRVGLPVDNSPQNANNLTSFERS